MYRHREERRVAYAVDEPVHAVQRAVERGDPSAILAGRSRLALPPAAAGLGRRGWYLFTTYLLARTSESSIFIVAAHVFSYVY